MKLTDSFTIEYVDNLGQGICKKDGKVYVIPKTLPGEQVTATVDSEKTKVAFATAGSIEKKSPFRELSSCSHYEQCQACHYLHTSYHYEVELKHKAHARMFKRWKDEQDIHFVQAPQRDGYRNRIQLHYDRKKRLLGYRTRQGILPVPSCVMPSPAVKKKLQDLYHDNKWLELPLSQSTGHIELYEQKSGEVSMAINESYSHGGFTQVFDEMSKKIVQHVSMLEPKAGSRVIDLFGGNGPLSRSLKSPSLVVDCLPNSLVTKHLKPHQQYQCIDLYKKDALRNLEQSIDDPVDWLILDPPRSGLKNLSDFIKLLRPQDITYVSCSPATLVRDLKSIEKFYRVESLHFYDLFPSTYHLEVLAHLSKLD